MSFVSDAQRRKFYATPSLHKYIPEYEAATGDKKLPARVKPHPKRKHRRGQRPSEIARALAGGKR